MAKVKFDIAYDNYQQLTKDFSDLVYDKAHSSSKTIVYVDSDSHYKVEIIGAGLKTDADGVISKGNISEIDFETGKGKPLFEMTDMKVSVKTLHDAYASQDALGVVQAAFSGNDQITGSKGNDYIVGWGGNDTIHGGSGDDFITGYDGNDKLYGDKGNDVFFFNHGYGQDTVYKFDADGGEGKQDLIYVGSTDYTIVNDHNKNTIIDFSDGDTLTLIGVKSSHIDASDFYS